MHVHVHVHDSVCRVAGRFALHVSAGGTRRRRATPTRVTATHVIETRHPSGGILIACFERTPEDRAHPLVDEIAGELEALFGTWAD